MRKAQGLSINMMVIAAIALVVLVVSIALYTGFFNKRTIPFLSAQTDCEKKINPGTCMDFTECQGPGKTAIEGLGCKGSEVCCIGDGG